MLNPAPSEDKHDAIADFAPKIRVKDDLKELPQFSDHVHNLISIKNVLITRRRFLAQDAMAYPVVAVGRAQDIVEMSNLIFALEKVIDHESELKSGNQNSGRWLLDSTSEDQLSSKSDE